MHAPGGKLTALHTKVQAPLCEIKRLRFGCGTGPRNQESTVPPGSLQRVYPGLTPPSGTRAVGSNPARGDRVSPIVRTMGPDVGSAHAPAERPAPPPLPHLSVPRPRLLLAAIAAAVLAACDTGDAIDPPSAADVAGVYDIEAFRFTPTSSALAPVSVLDTLVAAETFVEILDGGQATLRFRREGGTTRLVTGGVEVRAREVRVTFEAGSEPTLARLVLPRVLTLTREGDDLTVTTAYTANLEAYDATRYGGFSSIPGTLALRLALRGD